MKIFILFAPAFLDWPLAVCRALQTAEPGVRFLGLATGPQRVHDRVAAAQDAAVTPFARLDDLERTWLATPVAPGARAAYEAKLGTDIFQRLAIADRHLGRGFIAGGETPPSPLSELAENPEMAERYLVGLLDYSFKILGEARPDLVFCHTVAAAPALALALSAQHLGIAFAQLRHTRIGNRVIVDTSPFDHLEPVRSIFERIVLTNTQPPALIDQARAYIDAVRKGDSVPDYVGYHSRRTRRNLHPREQARMILGSLKATARERLKGQRRDLRRPSPITHCLHELKVARQTRKLLRSGPFQQQGWRPSTPFAFFPLHVDPEASTMVQAPMHTDQFSVIEAIAKNLPGQMTLLVKEHLPMLGRRPAGYYERLTALPGVELASPFEQGTALVRDAALVTTISSTAGWEAMIFGRPVLIIAFPPYEMVNDGFVAEPDLTRLGGAIRAALAAPPAAEHRLLAYVAAALECSFDCPTEALWGRVSGDTVRENPEILHELSQRLGKLARGGEPRPTTADGSQSLHRYG